MRIKNIPSFLLCLALLCCALPALAADAPADAPGGTVIIGQINNPDRIHHDTREVYFFTHYFGDFWVSLPEDVGPLEDLVGGSYRLTVAETLPTPFAPWSEEHAVGVSLEPLSCVSGEYAEVGEDYLLVTLYAYDWEAVGAKELRFLVTEDTKSSRVYSPGEGGQVIYEERPDGTLHALSISGAVG